MRTDKDRVARRLRAMVAVAILVAAQLVSADDKIEHPEWKVGDKWMFRAIENHGPKEYIWTTSRRQPIGTALR